MTRRLVVAGRIQNIEGPFGSVRLWDVRAEHPADGTILCARHVESQDVRTRLVDRAGADAYILDRIFRDIHRAGSDGHDQTSPLRGPAATLPAEPTQPGMTTHGHPRPPRHADAIPAGARPDFDTLARDLVRAGFAHDKNHALDMLRDALTRPVDPVLTSSPTPSPSRPTHRHSTPSTPSPPLRGTGSNRDGVDRPRPKDGVKRTGSP